MGFDFTASVVDQKLVQQLATLEVTALTDSWPACTPNLPRHPATAHCGRELLAQPMFDHWLPRHQAELHAVIEHRVAPADKHDGASVDVELAQVIDKPAVSSLGVVQQSSVLESW